MGFEIPNGKYLLKVNECEERKPEKGGNVYLAVELEILDAAKEKGENSVGFKLFEQFSFSDKAEFRLVAFLDACYPPRFRGEEIPNDIVDRWLVADTRVEEYEGFERSRCRSFAVCAGWKGVDMKLDDLGNEIDSGNEKTDTSKESKKDGTAEDIAF
jgi:hypothetical protein